MYPLEVTIEPRGGAGSLFAQKVTILIYDLAEIVTPLTLKLEEALLTYNAIDFKIKVLSEALAREKEKLLKSLTPREREVACLIRDGYTNKMIAEKLFISVDTVETHRGNIKRKLGAESNADIISKLF